MGQDAEFGMVSEFHHCRWVGVVAVFHGTAHGDHYPWSREPGWAEVNEVHLVNIVGSGKDPHGDALVAHCEVSHAAVEEVSSWCQRVGKAPEGKLLVPLERRNPQGEGLNRLRMWWSEHREYH